jgi:hypothetical protein
VSESFVIGENQIRSVFREFRQKPPLIKSFFTHGRVGEHAMFLPNMTCKKAGLSNLLVFSKCCLNNYHDKGGTPWNTPSRKEKSPKVSESFVNGVK